MNTNQDLVFGTGIRRSIELERELDYWSRRHKLLIGRIADYIDDDDKFEECSSAIVEAETRLEKLHSMQMGNDDRVSSLPNVINKLMIADGCTPEMIGATLNIPPETVTSFIQSGSFGNNKEEGKRFLRWIFARFDLDANLYLSYIL